MSGRAKHGALPEAQSENRKRDRWELRSKVTLNAESSERLMSLAKFPWYTAAHSDRGIILVITVGMKYCPFIFCLQQKAVNFFKIKFHMMLQILHHRNNHSPTVCYQYWLLNLTYTVWALGHIELFPSVEHGWRGISKIDHIQWSISIYASVKGPSEVRWLLSWPVHSPFFSFGFLLSFPSCHLLKTVGLYQLGVPRCPPHSSIEGLEDTEVHHSIQTFFIFTSIQEHVKMHNNLFCKNCCQKMLLPSFHPESTSFCVSLSTCFCRENARPMCCCWWCMGATSWTQQVQTPAQRLVTWTPWPPCWRKWHRFIFRPPVNTWWSNWCHVRLCVLKLSLWCPSEYSCQNMECHWPHLHLRVPLHGYKPDEFEYTFGHSGDKLLTVWKERLSV